MGEAEKNKAQLCSAERGGSEADAGLKAEQEAQRIRLGRNQNNKTPKNFTSMLKTDNLG